MKLEPDLIGEHHVAATGDVGLIDSCLEWIEAEPVSTHQTRRRGCGSQWDNRETSPKDQQKNRCCMQPRDHVDDWKRPRAGRKRPGVRTGLPATTVAAAF